MKKYIVFTTAAQVLLFGVISFILMHSPTPTDVSYSTPTDVSYSTPYANSGNSALDMECNRVGRVLVRCKNYEVLCYYTTSSTGDVIGTCFALNLPKQLVWKKRNK